MHTSTVPHTRTHTSIRLRRLGSKSQGLRELLVRWLIRSSVNVREMGQPQIRRFPFHAAAPTGFNLDSLVLIPMRACPCKIGLVTTCLRITPWAHLSPYLTKTPPTIPSVTSAAFFDHHNIQNMVVYIGFWLSRPRT